MYLRKILCRSDVQIYSRYSVTSSNLQNVLHIKKRELKNFRLQTEFITHL